MIWLQGCRDGHVRQVPSNPVMGLFTCGSVQAWVEVARVRECRDYTHSGGVLCTHVPCIHMEKLQEHGYYVQCTHDDLPHVNTIYYKYVLFCIVSAHGSSLPVHIVMQIHEELTLRCISPPRAKRALRAGGLVSLCRAKRIRRQLPFHRVSKGLSVAWLHWFAASPIPTPQPSIHLRQSTTVRQR